MWCTCHYYTFSVYIAVCKMPPNVLQGPPAMSSAIQFHWNSQTFQTFYHCIYWIVIHYILGTGLVPTLRLAAISTTVITWWMWKKQAWRRGPNLSPKHSVLYFSVYDGKCLRVPMSYTVIRNLKSSAYDKDLLYDRRATDFSNCCTYDIIFTNTQALQTCSWQINAVLNSSKITPHFHYKHIYKKFHKWNPISHIVLNKKDICSPILLRQE